MDTARLFLLYMFEILNYQRKHFQYIWISRWYSQKSARDIPRVQQHFVQHTTEWIPMQTSKHTCVEKKFLSRTSRIVLFTIQIRLDSTRQTANKFRVRKTTTKQIKLLCIKLTFWIGYANSIASKSYWCFCIVESVKLLKGIWKKSTCQFQRFCFAKAFSFSFVVSAIELFIRSVLMIYHSRNISQTNATSVRNSKLKKSYACIRYRCLIFSEIQ